MSKKVYYVDIPNPEREDYDWTHLKTFNSREEAVEWIRDNIDESSENGEINLITEGEDHE